MACGSMAEIILAGVAREVIEQHHRANQEWSVAEMAAQDRATHYGGDCSETWGEVGTGVGAQFSDPCPNCGLPYPSSEEELAAAKLRAYDALRKAYDILQKGAALIGNAMSAGRR